MASMMEKIGEKFHHGDKKDQQHNTTHDTSGYGSNVHGGSTTNPPGSGYAGAGQPGHAGYGDAGRPGHAGYGGVGQPAQAGYGGVGQPAQAAQAEYGGVGQPAQAGYGVGQPVPGVAGEPEKKHEGLIDKIKKKKNPNKVRKEGEGSSSSDSD